MANILDYVDWRGDIPFSVSPFNEVDNLVFTQFCFIDIDGALSPRVSDGSISLAEAVAYYFDKHPDDNESMGLIVPAEIRILLRRMAQSTRYKDVRVSGFVNHIDENVQKQFCALTVELNENELLVVFRGTDDTLVGWKENFNMSFLEAVPAQLEAVNYLNQVAADTTHPRIFVGGHSKGGNLAIFAAIRCESAVQSRIVQVYSNDGPGYRREVVDSEAYRGMADRIVNIIPQSAVIGRLLEHDNCYRLVNSTATGLWQHDGFSWEVKGTQFVLAPALSQESEMIDKSLKKWIADMGEEQCEQVVDALYRVLTATNAKTLTDLTRDRNWFWQIMTQSDAQSKKTVFAALSQLTGEAGRLWFESILPALAKGQKPKTAADQGTPTSARKPTKAVTGKAASAPQKTSAAVSKATASVKTAKQTVQKQAAVAKSKAQATASSVAKTVRTTAKEVTAKTVATVTATKQAAARMAKAGANATKTATVRVPHVKAHRAQRLKQAAKTAVQTTKKTSVGKSSQ